MMNPFKHIKDDTKDEEKKKLHKAIENEAWNIAMKVSSGRTKKEDVDELERLYKNYFVKYPDMKAEAHAKKRIEQLRIIVGA